MGSDRIAQMARRVRRLHGIAYGWDATSRFDEALLDRFVEDVTGFAQGPGGRIPRPVLRKLVHVLDLCEENPDVPGADFVASPSVQSLDDAIGDVLALG
jgi:hypothetical protein